MADRDIKLRIDTIDPKKLQDLRDLVADTKDWPGDADLDIRVNTGDPGDPREAGYRKTTIGVCYTQRRNSK